MRISDEERRKAAVPPREEADGWAENRPDAVACESYGCREPMSSVADAADMDLGKPPSMLPDRLADPTDRSAAALAEDGDGRTCLPRLRRKGAGATSERKHLPAEDGLPEPRRRTGGEMTETTAPLRATRPSDPAVPETRRRLKPKRGETVERQGCETRWPE